MEDQLRTSGVGFLGMLVIDWITEKNTVAITDRSAGYASANRIYLIEKIELKKSKFVSLRQGTVSSAALGAGHVGREKPILGR